MPNMFLTKRRRSTKMFAEVPCRFTTNIKLITTKRPTLQILKEQILYLSYNRKQIIWGVIFLRSFGGLVLTLLKRCHQITIKWYAKVARKKRKCFVACECFSSQPDNPYLIYESRYKYGNLICKWKSKTMLCVAERGIVIMKGQLLRSKMIMQRHTIHSKLQYSLI